MKKIAALLFALCLALTLTLPAFADAGGPAFSSYDVTLTADTQYYRIDWNDNSWHLQGTLPAGTTVTVRYEYKRDGVDYASVSLDESDDRWYYIRLSDIHLDNKVYGPEEEHLLSETVYVLVIAEDGVPIYAGPNIKFDVVATVPQNIRLGYRVDNGTTGEATWAYVTYHEYKGWININFYASAGKPGLAQCCADKEPVQLWAMQDTTIYAGVSDGNRAQELTEAQTDYIRIDTQQPADPIVGTFSQGSKCESRYCVPVEGGTWYAVSVDGRFGWVFSNRETSNIALQEGSKISRQAIFMQSVRVSLYTDPSEDSQSVSVPVEVNTEIEKQYTVVSSDYVYYYLTLGDRSGWTKSVDLFEKVANPYEPNSPSDRYEEARYAGASGGTPIYAQITDRSTQIGTIPADEHVDFLFTGYVRSSDDYPGDGSAYRIRCGHVTGWVWENDLHFLQDVEYPEPQVPDSPNGYDGTWNYEEWNDAAKAAKSDPKYAADVRPDAKSEQKSGIEMSPLLLVLICVAVAAVLTITVCVTLMLIRRKRKK